MRAGSEVLTLRGAPQLREVHYCATDDAYKLQGLWYLYGEGWMGEWNLGERLAVAEEILVVDPLGDGRRGDHAEDK